MDVTTLLNEANAGSADAFDQLAEALYPELKAMARRRSRGGPGIGATTLVNEAFVRMLSGGRLNSADRQQFFGLAAKIMRHVIVDEVRYLSAEKRSGRDVTLAETIVGDDAHERAEFLLQVDEMLSMLESENERCARVFECRYFAGLTTGETAEALGISERTVERDWSSARSRIASLIDDSSE
ncbi:MAG: ECF-type sigma factor [Woeseiaceae bacterium]|nr:ECF-type sigma factor [Woeseiaceae bacterium]